MTKHQSQGSISLQPLEVIDLNRVIQLETSSYPPDEAATPLDLEYRAMVAKHLCRVAFVEGRKDFVGFVVGTAAADDTRSMTAEMMKNHDAFGHVLCIHSVVIEHALRRQGLASIMMRQYLQHARQVGMKRVLLLCKPYLIAFYQALGFAIQGESTVSHGKTKWIEMSLDLN